MISPGYRVVETDDAVHVLDGRRVVSVAASPMIRRAVRSLLHPNGAVVELDEAATRSLVDLLTSAGVIDSSAVPVTTSPSLRAAATFSSAVSAGRADRGTAAERLARAVVYVVGREPVAERVAADLGSTGVQVRTVEAADGLGGVGRRDTLVVGAAHAALNTACLRAGLTWLPYVVSGSSHAFVGPLIVPDETACWDCVRRRRAANIAYAEDLDAAVLDAVLDPVPEESSPVPPAMHGWVADIAGLVALRWLAARDPHEPGTLRTLLADDLTIRRATVFRVPRCGACGAADHLPAAAPWESVVDR